MWDLQIPASSDISEITERERETHAHTPLIHVRNIRWTLPAGEPDLENAPRADGGELKDSMCTSWLPGHEQNTRKKARERDRESERARVGGRARARASEHASTTKVLAETDAVM